MAKFSNIFSKDRALRFLLDSIEKSRRICRESNPLKSSTFEQYIIYMYFSAILIPFHRHLSPPSLLRLGNKKTLKHSCILKENKGCKC